jgi:hypothetical protein
VQNLKKPWARAVILSLSLVLVSLAAYAGTNITFNGASYTVPAVGDANWGTNVSNFLIAIPNGVLQKSGGTFTLTSEVDFGATYGLKSSYFKSKTTNPATTGSLRLGKTDFIDWRNNANGADLPLGINGSDKLTFDSVVVPTVANKLSDFAATTSAELKTVISDETGSGALVFGTSPTLTTPTLGVATATSINGTSIPSSKTLVVTTDTIGSLANTSSIVLQGVITDETGTGVLVFNTSPTFVTPTLGAATATSVNKMAITAPATSSTLAVADGKTLTASNTLSFTGTDGSSVAFGAGGTAAYTGNKLSVFAATTSSELAGVISDETGSGSLVFGTAPTFKTSILLQNPSGSQPTLGLSEDPDNGTDKVVIQAPATLSADYTLTLPTDDGNANQVLSTNGSGVLSWASPFTNPMTTTGDIVYSSDGSGTPTRLAGAAGVLHGAVGGAPSYSTIVNADVNAAAAIDGSKIQAATSSNTGTISAEVGKTTWTPTLSGCSGGTTSVSSVVGHYVRLGKMIFASFKVVYNQSGSPTGNITIGGLPTAATSDTLYEVMSPMDQNQTGAMWFTQLTASGSAFSIIDSTNAAVACSAPTTGRTFKGTIVYRVD